MLIIHSQYSFPINVRKVKVYIKITNIKIWNISFHKNFEKTHSVNPFVKVDMEMVT